ncbi:substrate-binding domain-containing protein [Streptomyces sp. DSM 41029]
MPRLADHRVGARGGSSAYGSTAGLRELAERGAAESGTPALVALSDGPAPERRETGDTDAGGGGGGAGRAGRAGRGGLAGTRLAASACTLRAHEEVPVRDLALADLRRVYAGEVTDWREVGAGGSLPTVLVSRGAASDTRGVLRRRLLNGAFEPPASSRDCSPEDHPKARPVRCELHSTEQVIATVARTPGALGHSEPRTTSTLEGVHKLSLDGQCP